jgi:hypothetical protein
MKRWLLASTIAATWLSAATMPNSSAVAAGIAPRGSCAGLTGLSLPGTQILSATQKTGYEVPPISWTPEHLCCRSPQWQEGAHLTRRSFGVR